MTSGLCTIGLDVGGTKIAAGLVAFPECRLLAYRMRPTESGRGGAAVLADTVDLARTVAAEANARGMEIRGLGLGVAELVDAAGNVTSGQTIDWRELPVRATLDRVAPAVVESDVRAAALAEARYGAGRGIATLVYVTVGTGISYSLVRDGVPYAGARGNALVLASAPLSTICPHCGSTVHSVLEEVASGPAIVARYNARRPGGAADGRAVLAAAAAGDANADEIVRAAGAALGNSVGFLVNVLDPEAVIVGGGLGLAGGVYWETFVRETRAHIWAETARGLPILPAALGVEAGVIGAALTSWLRQSGADERG